jgi:hypothetical protein
MLAIACGSSGGDSTFQDPNEFGDGGQNASGGTSGGLSSGSSGASGGPGHVDPNSACATSNAGTDRPPAYLVFMYDRSGSMGDKVGGGATKWTACKAAMEAFFGAQSSTGISASLQFFKQNDECNTGAYAAPAVAMRALPDPTSFSAQINAINPNGGTPTLPALQGALQYAQSVKAGVTNGVVAVVLVTDGDPNDCNSTVAGVAAAAAASAGTIKTYVIGIGPDTGNLNQIATGGGTAPAIIVQTNDPAQTTADLEKALGQIASSVLGCEYPLPAPPNGQSLDVNAVNVNYTPAGQPAQTLAYSADCSDPNGWHYDNVGTPTKVEMCPGICQTLKADTSGGKLDVIFGCKTAGNVTK